MTSETYLSVSAAEEAEAQARSELSRLRSLDDWIDEGFSASALRRLFQSGDVRLEISEGPKAGRAARLLLRAEATWGRATYASRLSSLAGAERKRAADPEVEEEEAARRLERATQADQLRDWVEALLEAIPKSSDGEPIPLLDLVSAAKDFVEHFATTSTEIGGKGHPAGLRQIQTLRPTMRPARIRLRVGPTNG